MDRMPRLRYGTAHIYNCILSAQELANARASIKNEDAAKHIVSNGASSTCGGHLLMENSVISGIANALNSGMEIVQLVILMQKTQIISIME